MVRYFFISFIFFTSTLAFSNNPEIDSLIQNLDAIPDSSVSKVYKDIFTYYANSRYDSAIHFGLKGLKRAQELDNREFIMAMQSSIASVYITISDYQKALSYLNDAAEIARELGDQGGLSVILNNMGIVHASNGDHELAIKYYTQAIETDDVNNENIRMGIEINIGACYFENNEYQKAIQKFSDLKKQANQDGGRLVGYIPILDNNIGDAYFQLQQYDSALLFFKKSVEEKEKSTNPSSLVIGYLSLGDTYLKLDKLDLSRSYYQKSAELSEEHGLKVFMKKALFGLSEVYEIQGRYDSAFLYHKQFSELNDSIFNYEKSQQLYELEVKYELDKKEREIDQLTIESAYRNNLNKIGLLLVILVILVFSLIYSRIRLKSKLLEKDNILQAEKANTYKKEVATKNRELMGHTLQTLNRNNFLISLKEELNMLLKKDVKVSSVLKLVKENMNIDKDWEDLKIHFEQVHPEFFNKIQKEFPELTPTDLRHCAYIKINLSAKDVARIMNVDYKSVKMTRYRLKKKFNLNSEDSLDTFVSNF